MKAAVLYGPQDLRITDFQEPALDSNSVKIKVHYCGICGTDFHKYEGKAGSRQIEYPVPLGHEVSGIVEAVGNKVTNFKAGDRVTADPNWSCGKCWYCKSGKRHLCDGSRGVVKGMAELICPPEENVYHIPDSLSLADAALTEPLSCCLHGVDILDIKLGETVCIIGLGAIGQLILQLCAKSAAARIIVVEPIESKREKAMHLGATLFINPKTENIHARLEEVGIECIDKIIECVGLPETAETAFNIAGKGATVVLFGVADPTAIVKFNPYEMFKKELIIKTSYINPNTTQRAIELLSKGSIDTCKIISKIIELDEFPEEISTRKFSKEGKVLVRINA